MFVHRNMYVFKSRSSSADEPHIPSGNILILRGNIHIFPEDRTRVSYEFLAQLLGEYLLMSSPDVDLSAALSTMPVTRSKPVFCRVTRDVHADHRQRAWI